jgi:hypothetical protein
MSIAHGHEADTHDPAPGFIAITLDGGPHDGQAMNVPADEYQITLHDNAEAHRYHRTGTRPVFIHEAKLGRMFGGGH